MINRQFIIRFIEQHRRDFETIKPSFFEWTTALAFEYFKQKKVDLAVIETGMGGRLDSTNIITPVISIITNIGWDHAHLLGNTLQKIAAEKAGIIKHGVPLVIGEKQKAIQSVFKQKAKDMNTQAVFASENFETEMKSSGFKEMKVDIMHHGKPYLKSVRMDLAGHYQLKNVCTVLQSVHLLNPKFPVKKEQIIKALKQVRKLSGFNGRWTVLAKRPLIIADTGHNKEGIAEVMKQINTITYKRLHIVLGMVADKDIASVLKLLPKTAYYYFCQPAVPRGLDAVQLAEAAAKFKLAGNTFSSVKSALKAAKKQAGNHDLIFIGGSTFVVAEII
jgi:dihydrofolate synthase/folylpolyglutamate synthase